MKCEKLDVWKKSARLSANVYKAFKECKDFSFKDQITRSSLSIPSNIAEGMEKESYRDKIRYLDIAKGSTAEFTTQVYIAMDIEYLDKKIGKEWIIQAEHILAMIKKLQQSLWNKNNEK